MKKQYIYSALILSAILCAGCAKEFENTTNENDGAAIELSSVSTDPMTKAVITGTSFTTDEAAAGIGLFLLDGSGNSYGSNPANVRYGYSDGKWTAASPLRVGNISGTLVGYYPYSSTVTDITAIPVVSSINGTDYLYGSIAEITSAKAKSESLTLSHALTRLKITFKLDNSFVGSGTLSSLTIEGDGIAASGALDATTGIVTATKSAFTVSGLNASISTGLTEDCLVVPAAGSNTPQAVTLRFTVDGKAYKVDLTDGLAVKLQSGIQTDIALTVKNTSVSVDGSSIGAWGEGGSQTVEVGGDYMVTVKLAEVSGIEKDIMVTSYADGTSVVIMAQAASGRPVECILPEDKLCDFTKNNNIYTFTISDISSDLTATVGYMAAHSVSLNKDALNLIKEYGHYRLVATVLPEEAEDKSLIWSSSDETVAMVDQNGYVKALATGSATITVETKVGGYKATSTVTVAEPQSRPDGTLPGYFSISDNRVVYFSKGNLYCSGAIFDGEGTVQDINNVIWGFETHQYDTTPSVEDNRNNDHLSHFMWCNSAKNAMALKYDSHWNGQSSFFAEKDFSVGGVNAWSTPTKDEWSYLLNTRTMKYDVPRYTNMANGITIEGANYSGLFIYPDDYDGMVVGDASETWTWENINGAGIVFLPAAGYRHGGNGDTRVSNAGSFGYYWSASSSGDSLAFDLDFSSGNVSPGHDDSRNRAYSVRLVTESK